MTDPSAPTVGKIQSADIAVPQHGSVVRFYAAVLSTGENPLWREDLMNNRGMPIIGVGARTAEYDHLPLQWMPHIQVADVAQSLNRALALGGTVQAKSDDEASQWAVILDPNGAAFGLIPVQPQDEASADEGDRAAGIGRISWLDLTVADASATRDFYREVIGWSVLDVAMEEASERYADYKMLQSDGTPAAGVGHARGVNRGLPPVWLVYLPVGDFAESLRRVIEGGGKVLKESTGPDAEQAYAVIQDPAGACLALSPE